MPSGFRRNSDSAQPGIPRLRAKTCFRLVLRRLFGDEIDSLLFGLMLATISPPKSPTPSTSKEEKRQVRGFPSAFQRKFSSGNDLSGVKSLS
jgi:hypothetical protein